LIDEHEFFFSGLATAWPWLEVICGISHEFWLLNSVSTSKFAIPEESFSALGIDSSA
jgi:hypothetical protein